MEPRWTTGGCRAESANTELAFSKSHLLWDDILRKYMKEKYIYMYCCVFDSVCCWQRKTCYAKKKKKKVFVDTAPCTEVALANLRSRGPHCTTEVARRHSQCDQVQSGEGFNPRIVALDVGNLRADVQAAPVHWTLLIPVTDKTGASILVPQAIITSSVWHFFYRTLLTLHDYWLQVHYLL